MDANVILIRALKTFVQAAGAVVLAGVTTAVDGATTKALIIGAVAAGISAVMNLFIKPTEPK